MTNAHRILVVANRTCPCPGLHQELRTRADTHDGTEVMIEADEVIISTHPPGHSHWLEGDLLARTRDAFDGPVAHVTSAYDA